MFKTKLQELCHRKSYKLPEYSVVKQGQDHDPRFEATVTVDGKQFCSSTPSKSSKQAQNDAAKLAFDFFSLPSLPQPSQQLCPQPVLPESSSPPKLIPSILPFSPPSLDLSSFPQPSLPSQLGNFGAIANLDNKVTSPPRPEVKLEVANKSSELKESSKGQSVEPKILNTDKSPVVEDFDKECLKLTGMQHLYKNKLQNFSQKRSLTLPMYTCERDGPPHASRFRCKVEIDGKTYGSPEFHGTLKDAENAVAKVALMCLCQDGAQEDSDSGLYKNLLQEMAQKGGLGLPAYSTSQSGEVHVPVFVSTVKVGEENFEGKPSRTKKQAEMSAAKVAFFTIKEGSQSISTRKRAPSCDLAIEVPRAIATSSHNVAQPGESNDYVSRIVSKLEAGKSSSSKRIFVCPRQPNMTIPKESSVLPISDDQWVAFSVETGSSQ
ncbi:double-stranded RNA-binding protein 1 isoform X2 [Cucumis melo]|uniref:Double-stranded RNA-binding protein 1 isoform X2 n=1 Tax=Cucumis melo TaxID=3656 RepID=A0ABM3KPV8_CUCME|nr:double-stranded RNA-binding protein 1 isoform X2 [Cucumis melo]